MQITAIHIPFETLKDLTNLLKFAFDMASVA